MTKKSDPKEWLVIQVKTAHDGGIGDDMWQEFHFYPHYTVKEWDLFAQELAGSISDWLTRQRRQALRPDEHPAAEADAARNRAVLEKVELAIENAQ